MGLFRRATDDTGALDPGSDMGAPQDPQQSLPAPSVDGVLPPGVPPQPAPSSHNLSSQSGAPIVDDVLQQVDASLQQSTQSFDDPAASDAGDYIMTDPPALNTPFGPQGEPAQSTPAEPQNEAVEAASVEPTYEEAPVAPMPDPVVDAPEANEPEPTVEYVDPAATESDANIPESSQSIEATAEETPVAVHVASDEAQDLGSIKLQALQQLSSIAGHLEQSPEEKFHTTMMMLQATDDQSLIKTAYDAAQAITDEKTRAQALLDVVNEINYFAQKSS